MPQLPASLTRVLAATLLIAGVATAAEPGSPTKPGWTGAAGAKATDGPSASPRVTAAVLHADSMDAARSWGVVIDGQPGPRFFNYQVQLAVTPPGTWIACWTQGGYEADHDQRVVIARSLDGGRTWSGEIAVEEAGSDYRVPAWGMRRTFSRSGIR